MTKPLRSSTRLRCSQGTEGFPKKGHMVATVPKSETSRKRPSLSVAGAQLSVICEVPQSVHCQCGNGQMGKHSEGLRKLPYNTSTSLLRRQKLDVHWHFLKLRNAYGKICDLFCSGLSISNTRNGKAILLACKPEGEIGSK